MKKLKNLIPLLLVLSLTITALSLRPVASSIDASLSVLFPNGTNLSIGEYSPTPPNNKFTIRISVGAVIDLYGYEFTLKYDPSILTATRITMGDFLKPIYKIWKNETDDPTGTAWFAASQGIIEYPEPHPEPKGVTGSGTLATIDFTVDTLGPSMLLLSNTKLSDSKGNPIAYTTYIGFFENPPQHIAVSLETGWVEHHRWRYTLDQDKLINFTARIKSMDTGITYARVRFSVLDAEGFPSWETISDDVLVTYKGQEIKVIVFMSPTLLVNNLVYDIVFTVEYIDGSGSWALGQKGSPSGQRMTMIKSFTAEELPT